MEEIFVPASGMALEEVELIEWLKQPGDEVSAGEAVAVVETDKAMVELSGTSSGRLGRHLFEAGAQVQAGATVAYVLEPEESEPGQGEPGQAAPLQAEPVQDTPSAQDGAPGSDGQTPAVVAPNATQSVSVAASSTRAPHALSPRQRRELLAQAAAPATTSRSADPVASGVTDAGADGFRRAIAEAVAKSWAAIPHFAVGRDVDAVSLLAGLAAARATQPGVTVTDLLLVSLAGALHADGRPSDIGLAVATEWGVLIPVVRLVAGQTVGDIAGIRKDAVERARARRLGSDDATVPFATLSNLGSMGVEWFTGIIPIGQTALLTVGAIVDRPVVHAGGIAIRARFSATLTADHRRFDGADSARLLARFVEGVESVNQEGVS